jgi:hypothetical protein
MSASSIERRMQVRGITSFEVVVYVASPRERGHKGDCCGFSVLYDSFEGDRGSDRYDSFRCALRKRLRRKGSLMLWIGLSTGNTGTINPRGGVFVAPLEGMECYPEPSRVSGR